MSIRLLHGDCLIELPKLAAAGERFHAVVCDPPYGLEFMGAEWDKLDWRMSAGFAKGGSDRFKSSPALPSFSSATSENRICRNCKGTERGRDRKGFHRCKCDAPDFPERTYTPHDSGLAMQMWHYQWARAVYEVLLPGGYLFAFGGTRTSHRLVCAIEDAGFEIRDTVAWLYGSGFPKSLDVSKAIDKAAGAQREVIDRVRVKGGGTEHINRSNAAVHDYRPDGYQKGENVLDVTVPATPEAEVWQGWGTALKPAFEPIVVARKPLDGTVAANVLKHGCGALNIDASRVETGNEDFGDPARFLSADANLHDGWQRPHKADSVAMGGRATARFDRLATLGRWPANIAHDGSEEVLAAFAAFGDSSSGVQRKPRGTGGIWQPSSGAPCGPQYGDRGLPARFFYSAKADKADRADSKHPTVKPVDLIRWLVTLACPPGGHVLDCFAGSGTTGEACMLAGFDCTLIEREAQHARDIEHRIKRWSGLDAPLFADAP